MKKELKSYYADHFPLHLRWQGLSWNAPGIDNKDDKRTVGTRGKEVKITGGRSYVKFDLENRLVLWQ